MYPHLAQSIAKRHLMKLAGPDDPNSALDQTEAMIGRDSRNNPTKENIDKNTKTLDNLAEGQYHGARAALGVMQAGANAPRVLKSLHDAAGRTGTAQDILELPQNLEKAKEDYRKFKATISPRPGQQKSPSIYEVLKHEYDDYKARQRSAQPTPEMLKTQKLIQDQAAANLGKRRYESDQRGPKY